jgi:hypothetical protein
MIAENENPPILTIPVVKTRTSAMSDETIVDEFDAAAARCRKRLELYEERGLTVNRTFRTQK